VKLNEKQFIISDSWFIKNLYYLDNEQVLNYPLYQKKIKKEISSDGLIENYSFNKKINIHRKDYFQKILKLLLGKKNIKEIILFGFEDNYSFFEDLTLFLNNELKQKKYNIVYYTLNESLFINKKDTLNNILLKNKKTITFKNKRDFLNFNTYKEVFKFELNRIEQLFLLSSMKIFDKNQIELSLIKNNSKIEKYDDTNFLLLDISYFDLLSLISKYEDINIFESQEILEISKNRSDILYFDDNKKLYIKKIIKNSYNEINIIKNILSKINYQKTNYSLKINYMQISLSVPLLINKNNNIKNDIIFNEINIKDKINKEFFLKKLKISDNYRIFSLLFINIFGLTFFHKNLNALYFSNNLYIEKNEILIKNEKLDLNLIELEKSNISNLNSWYFFKNEELYSFINFFNNFYIKEDLSFECPICQHTKYGNNYKFFYCLNNSCRFRIDKTISKNNLKIKNIKLNDLLYLIKNKSKVMYNIQENKKGIVELKKIFKNNNNLHSLNIYKYL